MRLCVFEDRGVLGLEPLTLTRAAFAVRCGMSSLLSKQRRHFAADVTGALIRPPLAEVTRQTHPTLVVNDFTWLRVEPTIMVNARWLPPIANGPELDLTPRVGLVGEQVAYAVLPAQQLTYCSPNTIDDCLENWKQTLPQAPAGGTLIAYPWDLIVHHGETLRQEALRHREQFGRTHRPCGLNIVGPSELLLVDPTATIEPDVVADTTRGPVMIDQKAVIQSFSRLDGPCYIGPETCIAGAKLRNSTVGAVCRVGGEVDSSIIHGYSNKYHDGFLGHSYVGKWVNLAAGVQVSDLRHDYGPVRVIIDGHRVDTGITKVGAFFGDHSKIGLGALINTGSVFGAFSNVLPSGTYQPRGVPSFCRVENGKLLEPTNLQTVLTTATEVMRRRGCELSVPYAAMVHALYDSTAAQRTQAIQWSNRRQMRRSA